MGVQNDKVAARSATEAQPSPVLVPILPSCNSGMRAGALFEGDLHAALAFDGLADSECGLEAPLPGGGFGG